MRSRFALSESNRSRCGWLRIEPDEMQSILDRWIKNHVTPDDHARPEVKARRARQCVISVSREPGKPGSFQCTFSLLPHYQLDDLSAAIRLQTTMSKRRLNTDFEG